MLGGLETGELRQRFTADEGQIVDDVYGSSSAGLWAEYSLIFERIKDI